MKDFNKIRWQKKLPLSLLLLTLSIGILIGTVINTDVQADRVPAVSDATPLQIPSPEKLQNEFAQLAQKLGPAVVNITTEYAPEPKEVSRGQRGGTPEDEMDLFRRFFGEQNPQLTYNIVQTLVKHI